MWNELTTEERRDMLAVHDVVRDCRDGLPDGFVSRPLSEYGLDIFLGGRTQSRDTNSYAVVFDGFARHMARSSQELPPGVAEFLQISHRRLQSELAGHPRSERIVTSFRESFRNSFVHPVLG